MDFADDLLATIDTALEARSVRAIILALMLGKERAIIREQQRQLPEPIFKIPGEEIIAILHSHYRPRRSSRQ